ncbi:hypothetical protein KR009_003546, partial [Drosophila setifemur]
CKMINEFGALCGEMFNVTMKLLCTDTVPIFLIKIFPKLISLNDPYTVFELEGRHSYFLAFYSTRLRECKTLKMIDTYNFRCEKYHGKSSNLNFGYSHRVCFNSPSNLTLDLINYCGVTGHEESRLSAFYFANEDTKMNRNDGCLLEYPNLVVCLLVFLLFWILKQWQPNR